MMRARLDWITAALLAAAATGCALDADPTATGAGSQPIINGDPVGDADYPSVAALVAKIPPANPNEQPKAALCTATLISPTTLLTAAHCVDPRAFSPQNPNVEYFVTFAHNAITSTPEQRLAVASVEFYEGFPNITLEDFQRRGPKQWKDIGLVHLAQPITNRPFQKLGFGAEGAALLEVGATYRAVGYGLTNNDDQMSAGVLTQGHSDLDEIGDFEVAVGDMDRQQACHGDSGGPVMAEAGLVQVGIASRINAILTIPPRPTPCVPGLLYTRVDAYEDWIREHTPDLGSTPTDPPDAGTPDGGTPPPGPDGGTNPPPPTPDAGTDNPGDGDETGGCGCQTGGSNAGGLLLVGAIGLVALRRRRTARRA